MKVITTRTHGVLDYIVGLLLIAAPWIFNFNRDGAETWVPVVLGAGTIVYSLMTDYELGAFRVIGMRTHLAIDVIAGLLLAISPWLFGFADYVWAPHVIVGVMELIVVALSKSATSVERRKESTRGFTTAH
jgi:SPW repeat-containing protein